MFSSHLHLLSLRYETVDINVAISTDAGVLLTPIVYNVDQKVHEKRFSTSNENALSVPGSLGNQSRTISIK